MNHVAFNVFFYVTFDVPMWSGSNSRLHTYAKIRLWLGIKTPTPQENNFRVVVQVVLPLKCGKNEFFFREPPAKNDYIVSKYSDASSIALKSCVENVTSCKHKNASPREYRKMKN